MPQRQRTYRQGDLDGLCGVYAIVNALRYVLHLNNTQCQSLFGCLVKALAQTSRCSHKPLIEGMMFGQLKRLVAAAGQCRCLGSDCTFQVRPLRLREQNHSLPTLWRALDEELGRTCVALIGLTGADDHWCVVYRVTPKTLWLLDSSGRTRIRRSRCTVHPSQVRYCLDLGEILLIER
jgi:hypothetical protein